MADRLSQRYYNVSEVNQGRCCGKMQALLMAKDFTGWTDEKAALDRSGARPYYHAREIWWCAVGTNIGNEIDGTGTRHDRPVIILRPFSAETFFGVALVGHAREGRFYFPLGKVDDRDAAVNLSQARLYDTKRLVRKIVTLDEDTFEDLRRALAMTLLPGVGTK